MSRRESQSTGGAGLFARAYDPAIAPAERLGLGRLRRETLSGLSGDALELGAGTGRSLSAYPPGIASVTGIDPDEAMLARAELRAREAGFPVRLLRAEAEDLPFGDESFDAVSAFLTLCTVRDQQAALAEARRVLIPGGELRLLEHVRLDSEPLGRLQEAATPVWKHLAGGCHLDRRTLEGVRESGLEVAGVWHYMKGFLLRIYARRQD